VTYGEIKMKKSTIFIGLLVLLAFSLTASLLFGDNTLPKNRAKLHSRIETESFTIIFGSTYHKNYEVVLMRDLDQFLNLAHKFNVETIYVFHGLSSEVQFVYDNTHYRCAVYL